LGVSLYFLVGEVVNNKFDKRTIKRLQDMELLEEDKKNYICS
jgi:hypothetical protein